MEVDDASTWYKDAIIYELHVRAFNDSNVDGIGDFPGLIDKLDYIESLGVTALWLLPFYPSPLKDDGYDVDRVLSADDLVSGQDVFVAATGVTTGALLHGVSYTTDGAVTDSLVMRSRSGTIRKISAEHSFEKLGRFTGLEYR